MMQHRIESITEKKLVGMSLEMSLVENQTAVLWRSFMPRRKEILHTLSNDLISMQVYAKLADIQTFQPAVVFEKWAAVEVSEWAEIPEKMKTFALPSGLYAVFSYKGTAAHAPEAFQYIFGVWLPSSEFELDHRPHFEVLGEKYKNNDPDSEEEIWIPIRIK
ncbi:MAG: GyrI-like domain-containing protein [Bacteroidia bacterium]